RPDPAGRRRLRARRGRRAPRRLRVGPMANPLDRAGYRFFRTAGHSPALETAARRFSLLGEHAAIWLAVGAARAALDESRRERWVRGLGAVAGAYVLNTAIKLAVRRRRPQVPGLPPLTGTPTGLSFS